MVAHFLPAYYGATLTISYLIPVSYYIYDYRDTPLVPLNDMELMHWHINDAYEHEGFFAPY